MDGRARPIFGFDCLTYVFVHVTQMLLCMPLGAGYVVSVVALHILHIRDVYPPAVLWVFIGAGVPAAASILGM